MRQEKSSTGSNLDERVHLTNKQKIGLFGNLVSPTLEKEFRVYHLTKDIRTCIFIFILIAVIEITLVVMDFVTEGVASLKSGQSSIRLSWVVVSCVLSIWMKGTKSYVLVDWITYIAIGIGSILMMYINYNQDTAMMAYSGLPLIFMVSFYIFSPASLLVKTGIGVAYSIVLIYTTFRLSDHVATYNINHFVGTFLGANIIGCLGSRALAISERRQFLRWHDENKLRVALESALTQIRELSGLLPICANCKSVRDDSDYWHSIESYIAANTDADFSHTICPDCQDALYPELTKQLNADKD